MGVGITTFGLAATGKCVAVRSRIGALSSQANINPTFKALGLRLLEQGFTARQVVAHLGESDENFEYRQVGVVDRWGGAWCATGSKTRPWKGHKTGRGYVAMGNALASENVVAAIAAAFEESAERPLADRLIRALEAGRHRGGQLGLDGALPERSAGIIVHEDDEHSALDLRIDHSEDAVTNLRKLYEEYIPHAAYHHARWLDPASSQPQEKFIASLSAGPERKSETA
jgi:uncharacterized Ntn-hydrolase superfamily protein